MTVFFESGEDFNRSGARHRRSRRRELLLRSASLKQGATGKDGPRGAKAADAEFFKAQQVESLEALQAQVGQTLKARKEYENHRAQRQQVSEALATRIEFPLPESLVAAETQEVLRRFMEDNLRRGVPEAEFEKNKKELYENARRAAAGRVKTQLLMSKVAQREKIQAEERDLDGAIMREALRANQRPEKLAKELAGDRDRLRALQQGIIFDKTLDFLVSKATVTTASPAS